MLFLRALFLRVLFLRVLRFGWQRGLRREFHEQDFFLREHPGRP